MGTKLMDTVTQCCWFKITMEAAHEETGLKADDGEVCCFPVHLSGGSTTKKSVRNSIHAGVASYRLTCNPSWWLTRDGFIFQRSNLLKVTNNRARQKRRGPGSNCALIRRFAASPFSALFSLNPSDISLWICVDVPVIWWEDWHPVSPVTAASTAVRVSETRKTKKDGAEASGHPCAGRHRLVLIISFLFYDGHGDMVHRQVVVAILTGIY